MAFALAAAAATALVATQDERWLAEAAGNPTRFALDLAADAKRLGDPVSVGGALLLADLGARTLHAQPVAAASERMAAAVVAAGAVSLVLKEAVGRERPDETSASGRFRPFSGHDAFPSGHATVAFALAASLDAETGARWVPLLAYPAAALTAWSRVRDRRHWPSDVVAGAAIGAGARMARRRLRPHPLAARARDRARAARPRRRRLGLREVLRSCATTTSRRSIP